MDCQHYITELPERKKGQHLGAEERGAIKALKGCYAKEHRLFPKDEMVCTGTLYNMVWAGLLPITPTELPEALKRKANSHRDRAHKKHFGQSISNRPEIAGLRMEEGHWEGDTVIGKRAGKEAVILSLLEKKTQTYLALRISGKTSEAVIEAMTALHSQYGERFGEVFKTITVDNGSEFADFARVSAWGT